jgi:hypothetical protein
LFFSSRLTQLSTSITALCNSRYRDPSRILSLLLAMSKDLNSIMTMCFFGLMIAGEISLGISEIRSCI